MDPLNAWKDDFGREVEEVLASRARSQERGEGAPGESFGGRLADLVIPPAGAYAELQDALKNLTAARAQVREANERLVAKETELESEREERERMKDGAVRLTFSLRDERAARGVAEAEAKKALGQAAEAARALEAARLDAEYVAARVEDWEREAMARSRAARELQARFDRVTLDSDAKDAEAASLRARLDAALLRAQSGEAEFAGARANSASRESLASRLELERAASEREARDAGVRAARAEAAERAALTRMAALEAELLGLSSSSSVFERESQRLVAEITTAREEAGEAKARERAAAAALAAERTRVQAETAALGERAEARFAEAERALERARRLEAEIPGRLESALREERARLSLERETADRELQLARDARRAAAARAADSEILLNEARASALRDAREQGQAAYAKGLSVAQAHAENAERALSASRRAEAAAVEKARVALAMLDEHHERTREEVSSLTEALSAERDRADAAVAAARRAEAQSEARLAGEYSLREAAMEEERATLRAQFEDARAKLEDELDAERRALRERWKEQTEALDRLRKDLDDGHPGL